MTATINRTNRLGRPVAILAAVAIAGGAGVAAAPALAAPSEPVPTAPGGPPVLEAPSLSISSPAPGAVVTDAEVAVSGTASSRYGIDDLQVNGRSVPATAAWTARVTLAPGANTIVVRLRDGLYQTVETSITVVRRDSPTPRCTVPQLRGRTLAGARVAMKARGCRLGRVLRVASSRPGRVIRQGVPAGRVIGRSVAVRITVGR